MPIQWFKQNVEHIQTQWNIVEQSRWRNIFKSFLNEWKLLLNPLNVIARNCKPGPFRGQPWKRPSTTRQE